MEQLNIDRAEALRYLGYAGQTPDEQTAALIDSCRAAIREAARPRTVWRQFTLSDAMQVGGSDFVLQGEDIRAHLAGCDRCILLAATLGPDIERLIAAQQVTDMARAVVLDACATTAIEEVCDGLQSRLAAQAAQTGGYLTARFSPGYGDWPIDSQREFVRLLDTYRKIGLTATADCILTPKKSVTAVIGVADHPVRTGYRKSCAACALRETCQFRKAGTRCE